MRTAPVMDPATYEKIRRSLDRARWRGASPPDQLNKDGLVWTEDRERQIRVATIRFILDEMGGWTPAEFLRRRKRTLEGATPTDMYICISEWIQDHLAHAQTGQ
jgi:hypothetical protein